MHYKLFSFPLIKKQDLEKVNSKVNFSIQLNFCKEP